MATVIVKVCDSEGKELEKFNVSNTLKDSGLVVSFNSPYFLETIQTAILLALRAVEQEENMTNCQECANFDPTETHSLVTEEKITQVLSLLREVEKEMVERGHRILNHGNYAVPDPWLVREAIKSLKEWKKFRGENG